MCKISVVMCCYNAEAHIRESIDSVLRQSFKDFEFIIWDDGSTDGTGEIIQSYKDTRIHYYYHENTGLGQALRLSCEKTSAPFIARMDADDICEPTRLEEEYNFLQSHPDTVLVSSAVNYIDEDGTLLRRSLPYTDSRVIKKLLLTTGQSVVVHPSTMFRKDAYVRAGGYMPLRKAQDIALFSRMCKLGKFYTFKKPLLNYRLAVDSITTQTQDSSYFPIINAYLRKFSSDDEILLEDVERYNEIVMLSKREIQKKDIKKLNSSRFTKSVDVRLYNILKSILGENIASWMIITMRNVGARVKYKV